VIKRRDAFESAAADWLSYQLAHWP